MRKFAVPFLLALAVGIPFYSHAQSTVVDPTDVSNIVSFIADPAVPGPNQIVHLSIEASGVNLNSSGITWKLNGTTIASDKGLTSVSFTTGDIGSESDVSVTITTGDQVITRSIEFTPGSVDLLVQPNTYTPPFYKGRTLWSHQSRTTLVAVPHVIADNNEVDPSGLVYTWTKDGTVMGANSGIGKSTFTFTDSVLSLSTNVQVDITTDDGTTVGSASATLTPGDPLILVYEDNPLYGLLLNREVADSVSLTEKEVTFSALPYFMSGTAKLNKAITYTWTTNGGSAQTGNMVTYRAPDNSTGNSQVEVQAVNTNTVLQSGQKDFLVQFGKQNNL